MVLADIYLLVYRIPCFENFIESILPIQRDFFFVEGTFAIISLMTAKAIDGTPLTSSPMTNDQSNGTSNTFEEMIILEKVGIATTLAFFVGIVQVSSINRTKSTGRIFY